MLVLSPNALGIDLLEQDGTLRRATLDGPVIAAVLHLHDQRIVETLVIAFEMISSTNSVSARRKMPFVDRSESIEALLSNGPHKAISVAIRVRRARGRSHHTDARVGESLTHIAAPFLIPIADQPALANQHAVIGRRHHSGRSVTPPTN